MTAIHPTPADQVLGLSEFERLLVTQSSHLGTLPITSLWLDILLGIEPE